MTTLPSFVELMASLGLESNSSDGKEDRPSYHGHSRSSSYSSSISTFSQSSGGSSVEPNSDYDMDGPPYIVVSSSNQTVPRDVEVDRRKHRVRYSPYMPAIVSKNSLRVRGRHELIWLPAVAHPAKQPPQRDPG